MLLSTLYSIAVYSLAFIGAFWIVSIIVLLVSGQIVQDDFMAGYRSGYQAAEQRHKTIHKN